MQKPPFRKEGAKRERANWIGISQKADLTSCKCDCAFSPSGCSQTRMRWVEIRKESKHAVCAEKTLKEFFFFFYLSWRQMCLLYKTVASLLVWAFKTIPKKKKLPGIKEIRVVRMLTADQPTHFSSNEMIILFVFFQFIPRQSDS